MVSTIDDVYLHTVEDPGEQKALMKLKSHQLN